MSIIILIFSFVAVSIVGFCIVNILSPTDGFWEKISLGFLVGMNFFTFILFLANWKFAVSYNLVNSIGLLIILLLIFLILNKLLGIHSRRSRVNLKLNFKSFINDLGSFKRISLLLLLTVTFSTFIYNFYWPVLDWDALAVYDFRAKTFLATGYMSDALSRGYFTGYPLFNSISHTFIYLTGFKNPMFFYSLIYSSSIIVFYSLLRKTTGENMSLIGSLFFALNPFIFAHARISYLNLSYMIFFAFGIIYFSIGILRSRNNYLLLGILLFAMSNWVRKDLFYFFFGALFLFLVIEFLLKKLKIGRIFVYLVGSLFIYLSRLPWERFLLENLGESARLSGAVRGYLSGLTVIPSLDHIVVFIAYTYNGLTTTFGFLLPAYFTILLYVIVAKRKWLLIDWPILSLPLLCVIFTFLGAYVFSNINVHWEDRLDSFYRLMISFLPIFIYSIIFSSQQIFSTKNVTQK